MNFELAASFENKARKLCRKDPGLRKILTKQFQFFATSTNHRSLKTHKLKGKRSDQYAIWIKGNLRALAIKVDNKYIFFDLLTHDEY